ncbi:MAG: hypothetical protein U0804_07680 [Gemmataceae bacterium]
MARCDEGYRCEVCGRDVEAVTDSDLYLRFVLGELPLDVLHTQPERHLRCNPALAQFIADPAFAQVACPGPFDKQALDPAYVDAEERRVTRAWRRLHAIPTLGLAIPEYPLSVTPEDDR